MLACPRTKPRRAAGIEGYQVKQRQRRHVTPSSNKRKNYRLEEKTKEIKEILVPQCILTEAGTLHIQTCGSCCPTPAVHAYGYRSGAAADAAAAAVVVAAAAAMRRRDQGSVRTAVRRASAACPRHQGPPTKTARPARRGLGAQRARTRGGQLARTRDAVGASRRGHHCSRTLGAVRVGGRQQAGLI
jgi:hypothetical protein